MIDDKYVERTLKLVRGIIKTGEVDKRLAQFSGFTVAETEHLVELVPAKAHDHLIFRKGEALPLIIQLPHALDEHSLREIGNSLFVRTGARGIWSSLVKRRIIDMAHTTWTHLTGATVGAAQGDSELVFLSLHGFVPTDANKLAPCAAVVSGGSWWPTARSREMTRGLRKFFNPRKGICEFPIETDYLGGTTNTQGRVLRSLDRLEYFIHMELSSAFRKQLVDDEASMEAFAAGIKEGVERLHHKSLRIGDPWLNKIGLLAKQKMSGLDILLAALGMTKEKFHETYGKRPRRKQLAADLGVPLPVIRYYLELT